MGDQNDPARPGMSLEDLARRIDWKTIRVVLAGIQGPRAGDPARTAELLRAALGARMPPLEVADSAASALALAGADRRPKLVAGSIYLVGEVRALLLGEECDPPAVGDPLEKVELSGLAI